MGLSTSCLNKSKLKWDESQHEDAKTMTRNILTQLCAHYYDEPMSVLESYTEAREEYEKQVLQLDQCKHAMAVDWLFVSKLAASEGFHGLFILADSSNDAYWQVQDDDVYAALLELCKCIATKLNTVVTHDIRKGDFAVGIIAPGVVAVSWMPSNVVDENRFKLISPSSVDNHP